MTNRSPRIQIDKGVPLPEARERYAKDVGGSQAMYPWADMVPGDSFFAPGMSTHRNGGARGLKHMSTSRGKQVVPGSEWTCRSVMKGGAPGVRVWRVK
jgi:hypothetical protein